MKNNKEQDDTKAGGDTNTSNQGVDKAPGEEKEKKEKVTMNDLKGKKVDGDPELESDQPMEQKRNNE